MLALLSVAKRQPHSKPRPKYRPSAWRYLFGMSLVSEAASQAPALVVLGGLRQPQESAGSLSRTAHHVLILPFCRKSSGLDLLYLTILPLSLVSSCRSLVRVFALIEVFQYHLVNRKPVDKTTKHHHLSTCCTLHFKRLR